MSPIRNKNFRTQGAGVGEDWPASEYRGPDDHGDVACQPQALQTEMQMGLVDELSSNERRCLIRKLLLEQPDILDEVIRFAVTPPELRSWRGSESLKLITLTDLAVKSGLCYQRVRDLADRNLIPIVRLPTGQRRIRQVYFQRWIDDHERGLAKHLLNRDYLDD